MTVWIAISAPPLALIGGLLDTLEWPKIVVGCLGIAFGVFVARKQIDRWNERR